MHNRKNELYIKHKKILILKAFCTLEKILYPYIAMMR